MPGLLKMSFRIEMMSRMMRWQLEIPLRQVLYISFSLAFLCNWSVNNNYHKYTLASALFFLMVTKYRTGNTYGTNWILKHTQKVIEESWKVPSLLMFYLPSRGESTEDYVQIGKRWIGILPWQSALWHLPYWNSVPCQPFPTPNSNLALTGGTWKATQLHPDE